MSGKTGREKNWKAETLKRAEWLKLSIFSCLSRQTKEIGAFHDHYSEAQVMVDTMCISYVKILLLFLWR
jgi:hypothetical protein